MLSKVATLLGVSLCLALPAAAAQTSQTPSSSTNSEMQGQPAPGMSSSSVRQHLMQDLEKAGYTNVKITPASFVAQAKNKQGEPVTMLISPDSVTMITTEPDAKTSASDSSSTTSQMGGTKLSSASKK